MDDGVKISSYRGTFFIVFLVLIFTALVGRLIDLQYFQHRDFAQNTQNILRSEISQTTRRGAILDARGRQLAISVERRSCAFDPLIATRVVGDYQQIIDQLLPYLNLTPAELDELQQRAARENARFVWIKRFLSDDEFHTLEKLRLPGVVFPLDYERHYPQKTIAASVVGFADREGSGLEGVEKICDPVLRGVDHKRSAWRDAIGRKLTDDANSASNDAPALNVTLTLDSYLQMIVEEELQRALDEFHAKSACAVVMDVNNGDILALAGLPNFDANEPNASPIENRLIQAIASSYEPGSIFKPFVIAGALDAGVITPETKFFCENGAWAMPGTRRVLHDVHGYGWLTTSGVMMKSSNIGMAKMAEKMGMDNLHRWIMNFGFGKPTGQPLAGEINGKVFPLAKWTSFSRGSVPMGQEIATTPIQIATAYCALANGGTLYKPRLISKIIDENNKLVSYIAPEKIRQVLKMSTSKTILEMLRLTVAEGTGKHAVSREYKIGGKTGTAQLAVNQAERAKGLKGYSPNRYIGSFVAIAPIDAPRIVVLVSVREPDTRKAYYGGAVAAPATREIIERTLKYLQVPANRDLPIVSK